MKIVTCVADNGFYDPPLFILPGQQLYFSTMDQCSITGRTATVSPKGFMNSNIFIKSLDHFSSNVPRHVKLPIAFVYNVHSIHYNSDKVEKAI